MIINGSHDSSAYTFNFILSFWNKHENVKNYKRWQRLRWLALKFRCVKKI